MKLYLDSSALVKRYVAEPGSPAIRAALTTPGATLATSRVAVPEVVAAIARAARDGRLDDASAQRAIDQALTDVDAMIQVAVTDSIQRRCAELVSRRALRGFDAIHLASALLLAGPDPAGWTFACSDAALNGAAAAERLTAWDPAAS